MFKEKLKQLTGKVEGQDNKKKIESLVFFLIVLIIVLVAINLIWNDNEQSQKSTDKNKKLALEQNNIDLNTKREDTFTTQLEDILQKINGVGKVKVLITYSQTSQTIPLYNEDTKQKDTQEQDTSRWN